jgi:hypothetical protein
MQVPHAWKCVTAAAAAAAAELPQQQQQHLADALRL